MGSLSLSLTFSHSRTRAFSRCPALSPSRSLHNQDGIGGSCRLVLRERAIGQWRLQEPIFTVMDIYGTPDTRGTCTLFMSWTLTFSPSVSLFVSLSVCLSFSLSLSLY